MQPITANYFCKTLALSRIVCQYKNKPKQVPIKGDWKYISAYVLISQNWPNGMHTTSIKVL